MKTKIIRIIVTAVLLAGAWLLTEQVSLPMWQQLLVYLVPYLLISYDVLGEAWEGIMDRDPFSEDLLMAIATIGALLIGFIGEPQLPEAVFVMLFFQVGEVFEDYAEDRSRDSISAMMDLRPDTANVERQGKVSVVAPQDVKVGETVVVKPGEKVPMDGEVVSGMSSLNTVALTGESLPRDVTVGDAVISGCVNLSGVLRVRVTKNFGESTASKIMDLVENAGENKSRSETFVRKFARVYTPIVVFLAIAVATVPPLFAESYGAAFPTWLYRALTFLVVSCPCALVISIPLTFFGGIGGASRKGILIKGGNYMDTLAKVKTVVFDKTGTLTKGVFAVEAVHSPTPALPGGGGSQSDTQVLNENELLRLAAYVEQYSTHPIAAALREAGKDLGVAWSPSPTGEGRDGAFQELSGHGVQAKVNGHDVCVGNEKMMQTIGITVPACERCKGAVGTTVHVAIDGEYAGHIVISDQVKDDSKEAIRELKKLGVEKTVMLTGDQEKVANKVATELGIDEYHAQLLPAQKVEEVERLLGASGNAKVQQGELGRAGSPLPLERGSEAKPRGVRPLAFVGDGINDAPVLARADVGIAMGALGSDAAIEAADIVLMDDKPSKIATAIRIARRTLRIAAENAWFAIGVKVAILILATLGLAGMDLAVFGDVGVMVLCVLNASRSLSSPSPLSPSRSGEGEVS